jgi:Putative rhamnosyl transferase
MSTRAAETCGFARPDMTRSSNGTATDRALGVHQAETAVRRRPLRRIYSRTGREYGARCQASLASRGDRLTMEMPSPDANMAEPWLVLITRIGVGISRDEHYRHRLRVADLALARSLRAQTDMSFTWVLVRDARAPEWVDDEIERLTAGLSFDIWRRDPTADGLNPVDRRAVRAMMASRRTILSRCDDDDLLHRTYVARTRQELAERTPPSALTFIQGGYLFAGKVYPKRYPWFTAGLAVVPDERAQITPYLFNHPRFGAEMRRKGFEAREIRTSHPMWLRSVSASSDSAARRRLRPRWWHRPGPVEFGDFGATEESIEQLQHALAEAPVPRNPNPKQSRLGQKMELAKQIRALKAAAPRSEEEDDEIERLTKALYDL